MATKWRTLLTTQDFRFWKFQKEAGSLTLDICVRALLGIGKLFKSKTSSSEFTVRVAKKSHSGTVFHKIYSNAA